MSPPAAHNGAFVKYHPSSKPASVGFFVAAGNQKVGFWSTTLYLAGFRRIPPTPAGYADDPLPWPAPFP